MEELLKQVEKEYEKARLKFPPFYSTHEGYGVIKEEFDELWDEIRREKGTHTCTKKMKKEAIQLAAMSLAFIFDLRKRYGKEGR